jgi:hypothetical protein
MWESHFRQRKHVVIATTTAVTAWVQGSLLTVNWPRQSTLSAKHSNIHCGSARTSFRTHPVPLSKYGPLRWRRPACTEQTRPHFTIVKAGAQSSLDHDKHDTVPPATLFSFIRVRSKNRHKDGQRELLALVTIPVHDPADLMII